ncbi:MAG: lysine--tRNA ligase [Dehalococcoidia bacterium]|nr:lysine--tRNA ligase [Dehalococcoidia bacterium]
MPGDDDPLVQTRRAKLARLRDAGFEPFPARTGRTHSLQQALTILGDQQTSDAPLTLAGRVVLLRPMGRASFGQLQDASGRMQMYLRRDAVGAEAYQLFRATVDLGDLIEISGSMFRTRTGEPTLQVASWQMMTKSLRSPPEKWHGLTDVEARLRRRHLDILANKDTFDLLSQRARIVRAVRDFYQARDYLEVETPVLQALHGGAAARPFTTYYQALDSEFHLRISLELYLKRLLVGGFERVFEIGRVFRNEGISHRHSPEYTLLESYEAYADYHTMLELVEQLVSTVAQQVLGRQTVTYQDQEIDLSPPWRQITLREAILAETGVDFTQHRDLTALQSAIADAGVRVEPQPTWSKLVDQLLDSVVAPRLIQPTFVLDYPLDLSPFAKLKPGSDDTVERFEAFAAGIELANAFSELNDPDDQYQRFLQQVAAREGGDDEAHVMDLDFVEALQQGMPPAGGLGVGIDRLVRFLLGQTTLRDVIFFPMLRTVE